ncbi:glutamine and serine-rich protein 1 [Alosa sapidissima]|uniref:glutamine and serine-rich protein 1 n=1 Tax=Alosa sapidissima TaxID=34773 RepID=UPI001C0A4497|nr:glutamine and serine-rich protein 1 [Alosa sapidissima]
MMDRNYPTPSFADSLAPPPQTAAWAYERSTACIKPSSSYAATHLESELLQRQTYASSQIPSYTTTHHPAGLSGVFETSLHTSGGNTTESSVMNFLPAIESRSLQAGPVTASLLPQFRTPSWQTAANSSTTELFLTGALSSSGTFPTAALSSYQHPTAFPSRSYTTTPSLTVQDVTYSSSNGLLPSTDPLIQIKSSQGTVPTVLAFDRLGGSSLGGAGLPPQSSTYRSAQESAPHLLQPQFSLLHSALGNPQQAPQPYGAPVFSGSIERALQRECSVIKHHQRPSSAQSGQEQLPGGGQHSLQGYLAGESDVSFQQEPSRQTPVPCNPAGDSAHSLNGGAQQKIASQPALSQSQAYPSSPGFSPASGVKAKDCASKITPHPADGPVAEPQPQTDSPDIQQQSYSSPLSKQSSVIATHSQPFTSTQLPSLMSISPSQTYITSQALSSTISHSQAFSSSQTEKLPSIYKTLSSFASQTNDVTSVSQSLVCSPSPQQQALPSVAHSEGFDAQVQGLCIGNPSQNYSSSLSQGLPSVSYYAQGPATASSSQSYATGQSVTQSSSFSSNHTSSLPNSNSSQDCGLIQPAPSGKAENALLQQPQKYMLPVQSPPSSTASHAQALQNNRPSVELKPAYGKGKPDENSFLTSKEDCGELPIQDVQALQQASLETSSHMASGEVGAQNNVVYVVSKMDDRHNTQSVIRSNSRTEDQVMGISNMEPMKNGRMGSLNQHGQLINSANVRTQTPDPKSSSTLMQSSHAPMNAEELKQHTLLLKVPSSQQQNHQTQTIRIQQDHCQSPQGQAQFVRVPGAQILLEPSQMIFLQQAPSQTGQNSAKVANQMQPVQYLHMNNGINLGVDSQNQQQVVLHQGSDTGEASKQHLSPKDSFSQSNQQDAKQHFTLSSICFPESMLLADERNILSNVDDILAATVAACGVTPQDFVKATSSEGDMPSIANPTDSKCHYQSNESRHESSNYSSQHTVVANAQSMTLAVNGSQLTTDIHRYPKDAIGGHQAFTLANSHMQHNTGMINPQQEIGEEANVLRNAGGVVREALDRSMLPKGHAGNPMNGASLNSSGNSNMDSRGPSNFHLAGQECSQSGLLHKGRDMACSEGGMGIKMENGLVECIADGLPKKKYRSKGSSKLVVDDENGQPRSQRRSSQAKRQNSKGSDTSSPSASEGCLDSYQQQERMRQKIREVEEKQPEVKTGFIGSFLDFLKSGPKQNYSSPPVRTPNRTRKLPTSSRRPPCPLAMPKLPHPPAPMISQGAHPGSSAKRLDEELHKNLETLPSFSSDEDEAAGRNQDLQKSISSALSCLDEQSDKKQKLDNRSTSAVGKQEHSTSTSAQSSAVKPQEQQSAAPQELNTEELLKGVPPDQLAVQLVTVAIEGLTDEELSDSGGEGMYRERDEFVVKNEDIESLKVTLKTGLEPPAIWKVQKALLQKFIPELRDGRRVFSATNSYLGYFGDAKTMYRRVYVKFLDTVNKREYVRVCSRKPRCKPMHSMRGSQAKALLAHRMGPAAVSDPSLLKAFSRPRPKQPKAKAEPPPKKRKKWKEAFATSPSASSPEAFSEDDEFTPPMPFASRFLNTRMMKETFRSYVELLISVALDAELMNTLESENDELLLPHMKRVDGMITDNRRRLLPKLRMGQLFKTALDSFPEISVVTELKKDGETPSFKVRLGGKAYNKKTMKPSKSPSKLPLEYTVDQHKTQWFSLYHSLQHYKYHTYLMCKDEITSLRSREEDLGQEETVQTCLGNRAWVEGLFDRFGELLTQVQQACL